MCNTCGEVGYTVEYNCDDVECIVPCKECDARDAKREEFVRDFCGEV